jgi:hypothetical protein
MGLSFTIAARPSWAQSFSGPSRARLMATFYCHRFETPPNWRAISPYIYIYIYVHIFIYPFSSPPTNRRAMMEVFASASSHTFIELTGWCPCNITPFHGPRRKLSFQQFVYRCMRINCRLLSSSVTVAVYCCLLKICCLAANVVSLSVSRSLYSYTLQYIYIYIYIYIHIPTTCFGLKYRHLMVPEEYTKLSTNMPTRENLHT